MFGEFDWCKFDCNIGGTIHKHTLCQYTLQNSTIECRNITVVTSLEIKAKLLFIHNSIRDRVANQGVNIWSAAANMREVSWDYTLEAEAAVWGTQCSQEEHDVCRKTPDFASVGQNCGFKVSTMGFPHIKSILDDWTAITVLIEAPVPKDFSHSSKLSKAFEQFAQIIWAETYKIGCAEIRALVPLIPDGVLYKTILVCNYGNSAAVGEFPYIRGPSCSKCPPGTKCLAHSMYPHLCTTHWNPPTTSANNNTITSTASSVTPLAPNTTKKHKRRKLTTKDPSFPVIIIHPPRLLTRQLHNCAPKVGSGNRGCLPCTILAVLIFW